MQAIRRWEIAGPKIEENLRQVESKIPTGTNQNDTPDHEHDPTHNTMFRKDYTTVVGRLLQINPFLEDLFIKVGSGIAYSEKLRAFVDYIPEVRQQKCKLRETALFCLSLCADVVKIEMTGLPECFTKKQSMYHGNKSQLLKIFDPTPYLTSTFKKDTLILDFSEVVNSQAAVNTAKTFNKFADGIIKFAHNLPSGLFTY